MTTVIKRGKSVLLLKISNREACRTCRESLEKISNSVAGGEDRIVMSLQKDSSGVYHLYT